MSAWLSVISMIVAAAASGSVKVPATGTSEIVPDGRIAGAEWSDATRVSLGEGVTLLIKANDDQIAIAVKTAARGPEFTDLYVSAADGQIWNLHVEKETSERKLTGATWTATDPAFVPYNNERRPVGTDGKAGETVRRPGVPHQPLAIRRQAMAPARRGARSRAGKAGPRLSRDLGPSRHQRLGDDRAALSRLDFSS